MSEFHLYFELGLDHILDLNGYDHMLFVVALSALYRFDDWKSVLVLITSFTIGHSVTLALATLKLISINADLVEFLIPLTILLTAISNLFTKDTSAEAGKVQRNYFYAVFFGLIHGLGFSNYLSALLGRDTQIVLQLFAFNTGLEVGQLVIVAISMLINYICISVFGVSRRGWKMIVSIGTGGISLLLLLNLS